MLGSITTWLCIHVEIRTRATDNILKSNEVLLMKATLRNCPRVQVYAGNTLYPLHDKLIQ